MKFKTTAIAMAVAGVVAAPVVAQAGADEVYASARIGVISKDTAGESELNVKSFSSRFGAKGETDLGNGLTGFGKYEWDVDESDITIRHRYVGVKGDFGSVLIGQTYHTFYNFNVGAVDIPWWHSGYNMVSYTSRSDNGLTYSGGGDGFQFGVTVFMDADATDAGAASVSSAEDAVNAHSTAVAANGITAGTFSPAEIADLAADAADAIAAADTTRGEDGIDGVEAGVSFGLGDMTLGIAIQDYEAIDDAVTGVTLSGIGLGPVTLALNVQTNDDSDGLVAHADIGNFYVHIEAISNDDNDPIASTLGYTQSLGSKTTMYYEVFDFDQDTDNSDDDVTSVMAVLKYDII